ncbi:MAG: GNAT family N-acetyltransferase [Methanosarcinaceae archaeon]|nr:GNAT family N-acetyltransferase [Methanosarcinaceae archaeon]
MLIRKYEPSKKAEVRELVLGVLQEHGFEYDRLKDSDLKDIENYYFKKGGCFFVGLSETGQLMGTSAVRNINSQRCEIRRIYLKKEYRGKGYGKKLFLKALDFAETNFSSARLKTDASLSKAINMYLKEGFIYLKEESKYLYFEKEFAEKKV